MSVCKRSGTASLNFVTERSIIDSLKGLGQSDHVTQMQTSSVITLSCLHLHFLILIRKNWQIERNKLVKRIIIKCKILMFWHVATTKSK